MRLATVLTPITRENLQLAAQCGVTDLVARYPGPEPGRLVRMKRDAAEFGLQLSIVEGYLPMENIKLGRDEGGRELQAMRALLEEMHSAEVPLLCYNFMAGTDWVRTRLDAHERGGALVTAFDLREAHRAVSLNQCDPMARGSTSADQLWANLQRFLEQLIPLAERLGITLAMHPDDPPLLEFQGRARIMNSVEGFERLVKLVPSPSNAICFCQGSFAEMEVDVPAAIRRLGPHIQYVHFRDIRGRRESFVETFHDNGQTDMVAAMRAYWEVGFRGPMRPDHVPQLVGEEAGEPGYTMLGRLFAFGYMRGLMQAVGANDKKLVPPQTTDTFNAAEVPG